MSLTTAPFLCFDFSPLDASGAAPPGPFALVSFLASLVLGLLYESSEFCFFALAGGAMGLLPLRVNMQDTFGGPP